MNPPFPFSPLILNLLERISLSLRGLPKQRPIDMTDLLLRPRMGSSRPKEVDELDVASRGEGDEGIGAEEAEGGRVS